MTLPATAADDTPGVAIEVERVTQRFGAVQALSELSFALHGNGIHGLLGRNGSGKTTLLSLLAGFRRPTAGTIRIDGEPVFENARIVSRICLIRESGDTVGDDEAIAETLRFAAYVRPNWDREYAQRLLDRFALSPKQKIGKLSRGQRAALAVTLGLASRAPLTVFDESYLGMDAPSRYAFYDELLRDYGEHPRTILLSTHLIEEVAPLFERVVMIDRGRLLLHDSADALRSRGTTVVGPADAVERLTRGLATGGEKRLGQTGSVVVLDRVDDAWRTAARAAGLETGPVPLQDLFVHLTSNSQETSR